MNAISKFNLKVVTGQREVFNGEVNRVIVRTTQGDIGILKGHANYVAALGIGQMKITIDGVDKLAAIASGMIKVDKTGCIILAGTCEWADEIDVERAKLARDRSMKYIDAPTQKHSIDIATLKLHRALNRIKIGDIK
ncbi:MAG: ATP synthase F1 subunit epsilon [Oscillospiraceae bacterium]